MPVVVLFALALASASASSWQGDHDQRVAVEHADVPGKRSAGRLRQQPHRALGTGREEIEWK